MQTKDKTAAAVLVFTLAAAIAVLASTKESVLAGGGVAPLHVMVVYESGKPSTELAATINAEIVRTYMLKHGAADGKAILFIDQDNSVADLPQVWQTMRKKAKDLPALVILNEKGAGTSEAVPPTPEKMVEKLQEYGGK